tara:strand:- start:11529 stop:12389 length:861 start_codon:yes stop_codon:yes gene_type:complete
VKKVLKFLVELLPFVLRDKIYSLKHIGYIPNVEDPQTYNEKIRWRMNNQRHSIMSECSDKIKVRSYVEKKVGTDILIPLIDVFSRKVKIEDISVPCVLKANHNSGPVFILRKKSDVTNEVIKNINNQIDIDYGDEHGEKWYSDIDRKIFTEQLILDNQEIPNDYKFHVFRNNGSIKVIVHVDFDRFSEHSRCYYDDNLNILPFGVYKPSSFREIIKPKNFEKMKDIAIKLSEDFTYARVDLFNLDGNIYFGEITFAPGAGQSKVYPKKFDSILGSYWNLKDKSKIC